MLREREPNEMFSPLATILKHFESPGEEGHIDQELLAESLNKAWVNEVPQEDIAALLEVADTNGSGKIAFQDIQAIFMRQ